MPTGSPGSPGANAGAIAFTGDFHDVPGAHVSARLLRVPLYVYMLDYYSHRERAIRRRGHLDAAGVAAAQQGADVLFLPLAFRSQCPEVIRTSAPMKFGGYLAAPAARSSSTRRADAFVSEYGWRHSCGLVVDDADSASLVDAPRLWPETTPCAPAS